MTFCQQCGSSIQETDGFCPECGTKVMEKIVTPNKVVNPYVNEDKKRLFSKRYNLIDENEEEYVFSKRITTYPAWFIICATIIFLPCILLFFFKKEDIITVEKYKLE